MLISLLVTVIILGMLVWLVTMLPIPEPFRTVAIVIIILVCILWLVGYVPAPFHR